MTEAAWHSLYVSFVYKLASLISTSLSQPEAMLISGVHCTYLTYENICSKILTFAFAKQSS